MSTYFQADSDGSKTANLAQKEPADIASSNSAPLPPPPPSTLEEGERDVPDDIAKLDSLIFHYRKKMVAHDSEIELIKGVSNWNKN